MNAFEVGFGLGRRHALQCVLVCCLAGCMSETDSAEVGVASGALSGTTLFNDAFGGGLGAWSRSAVWSTTSSLVSAASYTNLPAARSGAPVARVRGVCSGTCALFAPTLSTAGASAVSLEFSLATALSSTTGAFGVRAFDGRTWRDLATWRRASNAAGWRRIAIDLSAYANLSNFRFALFGRSLTSTDSAQVDDVQLVVATAAASCGDGVRGGTEACDGSDLGGNTCTGLGFNGGSLSCTSQCTLDSSACTDQVGGVDCRDPSTWPSAWTQFEDQVLTLTNQHRAAGANCGATPFPACTGALADNAMLRQAARCHSLDMATQNYFSHTGLDGSDPGDRIAATGYRAFTWGENIAAGYTTPQQVVDGWMNSEGHCHNIMNCNFVHLGVGYGFDSGSTYDHYWTQDFGASR